MGVNDVDRSKNRLGAGGPLLRESETDGESRAADAFAARTDATFRKNLRVIPHARPFILYCTTITVIIVRIIISSS